LTSHADASPQLPAIALIAVIAALVVRHHFPHYLRPVPARVQAAR